VSTSPLPGPRRTDHRGYILLPVALTLALLATVAFLITREATMGVAISAREARSNEAQHAARAGFAHAYWQVNEANCAGFSDLPATTFGDATYAATVTSDTPLATVTTYSVPVDQDTWLQESSPGTNHGSDTELQVKNAGGDRMVALLCYDLSAIPPGHQVLAATAKFYVTEGDDDGPVNVHRVTASWTENGATWSSFATAYDPAVLATVPAQPTAPVWVDVNLTALVQSWVDGTHPNDGIVLCATSVGQESRTASREWSTINERPSLEVVASDQSGPVRVTITATASLPDGTTRTVTRSDLRAFQGAANTLTLQPGADGKDTFVEDKQSDRNNGTLEFFSVEASSADDLALIQFDLGSVPVGAEVESARLHLYAETGNVGSSAAITAYRLTQSWTEAGVTYQVSDGTTPWTWPENYDAANPASTAPIISGPGWFEWDVTELVAAWHHGSVPNHGMVLMGNGDVYYKSFYTSEFAADPTLRPKLAVTYVCECGMDCSGGGSGTGCAADYTPTRKVDEFSPSAYGSAGIEGMDYLPEGTDISGELVPAGGGWVSVDSGGALYATDLAGTLLKGCLPNFSGGAPTGVTLVTSGPQAGNLAVAVAGTTSDYVAYVSTQCSILGSFSTKDFGIHSPSGITCIASSASGTYDGHLAITDLGSNTITITDQTGAVQTTLDLSSLVGNARGVAHLAGTDRLLVADDNASKAIVVDFGSFDGTSVREYDTAVFGAADPRGVAVNPTNCDHALGDGPADRVVLLNAVLVDRVLLVVGNPADLTPQETARQTWMEGWGFTVSLIDDGDTQANFDMAVEGNDVVYVSPSIAGGSLLDKLTASATGVANEFPGKLDNFGFSSSTTQTVSAGTFSRSEPTHYVTEPFGGNPIAVFNLSLSMPVPGLTTAPDLLNLAEVSGSPALVALETGAQRWDGTPSPARRVHLPFASAGLADLTADGQTLMRRAIEWAAGGGGATPPPSTTTLTLAPSQDTFLGGESTLAYGSNISLYLGFGAREWRPLLEFDVTAIPAGAIVTSATLRLHNWDDGASTAGALSVQAHRVTEPWTATWAGSKGANWYDRMKQGGGALPWATLGGAFDAGWSASASFDSALAPQWVEWELSPLVQEWVDGVSPNQGVLLVPDSGSAWANLRSSDFSDSAFHPQLVIEYTGP
jgi:Tfp pilus assembly protein PilX